MPEHESLSRRIETLKHRERTGQRIYRSELTDLAASAGDLEKRARRAEAETRAAETRASLQVIEPPIYGTGSIHSYFADMMRSARKYGRGDGGPEAARTRLSRHQAWQHHENERRLTALTADAERATEQALSQTRAEARLFQRWHAAGGQLFDRTHELRELEDRAMSRVPGQGGYLVPPGWLVDQFIHAPRAGAPFAAKWTNLPLPRGVDSINLPRFLTGAGTGMQTADLAALNTVSPADSALLNAKVLTLAATVDMSMQWLDMSPVPPDETIGQDLAEDFAMQLDGQLLLGSGVNGQLTGIIPAGTFAASGMVWLQSTTNVTGMSWANGGGSTAAIAGSLHQATAQLYRKVTRYRALQPTHWVVPSSVWAIICGSGVDSQDRPLVPPGVHASGAVPMLHGLPIVVDENIPETFGGSIPPYMAAASAGRVSPTDGNGTWVPIVLGRWADCLYFQSEPVVRIMDEALSGTGQVRFQAYSYVASAPGRVIWAGTSQTFSGTGQGGGVNALAPVSYGAVTNFVSNSILQPASAGY